MIPKILIVSQKNLQVSALEKGLSGVADFRTCTSSDILLHATSVVEHIVLIDVLVIDDNELHNLLDVLSSIYFNIKIALFNCSTKFNTKLIYNHLDVICGCFYFNDSLDVFKNGIKSINRNGISFPEKIMHLIILYVRESLIKKREKTAKTSSQKLTRREYQILQLLMREKRTQTSEIAEELFISQNTVKTHISHLFRKIGVRNRTEAVAWMANQVGGEQ